jgi:hypothetical protein
MMKRLCLPILVIALTACQRQPSPGGSNADATHVPATHHAATPTPTPLPAETPTVDPSATLIFPESDVANSLILSTGSSPDCQLPCWHGLRVGISERSSIEHVFRELLGASEDYDFFVNRLNEGSSIAEFLDVPVNYVGGYNWHLPRLEGGQASYYLYAEFSQDTNILTGIIESASTYGVFDVPSLPEVINRLGQPQWIYGAPTTSAFSIILFYERGITVYINIAQEKPTEVMPTVCFDTEPSTISIALVDPYTSLDEASLSPIQKAWGAPTDPTLFIDEILGMSTEEFTAFVVGDSPCLKVSRRPGG